MSHTLGCQLVAFTAWGWQDGNEKRKIVWWDGDRSEDKLLYLKIHGYTLPCVWTLENVFCGHIFEVLYMLYKNTLCVWCVCVCVCVCVCDMMEQLTNVWRHIVGYCCIRPYSVILPSNSSSVPLSVSFSEDNVHLCYHDNFHQTVHDPHLVHHW